MVNYGFLGLLSVILMVLYIFLILLMFTVLRGEYLLFSFAGFFVLLIINLILIFILFNKF